MAISMSEVGNFAMEPEVQCGALPVGYSFVAWEQQIIMLKTGSKFIKK